MANTAWALSGRKNRASSQSRRGPGDGGAECIREDDRNGAGADGFPEADGVGAGDHGTGILRVEPAVVAMDQSAELAREAAENQITEVAEVEAGNCHSPLKATSPGSSTVSPES